MLIQDQIRENRQKLDRSNNRDQRDADTRDAVRNILRSQSEGRPRADKTRVYNEAAKRQLGLKYWSRPPVGFKGSALQWELNQKLKVKYAKQMQSGERIS